MTFHFQTYAATEYNSCQLIYWSAQDIPLAFRTSESYMEPDWDT
jgi:hypothetical protein